MIEAEGTLQTLAEVSVALAGFASLLVVLRSGSAAVVSQGEGADLFIVVGGNLLVLAFSLLPLPLHYLGASGASAWRISGALLAAALLLGYVAILRHRAELLRAGIRSPFPRISRISVQSPLIVVALLLVNSSGLLGSPGVGAYLLALILLMSLSALPLVFLVVALAASPRK